MRPEQAGQANVTPAVGHDLDGDGVEDLVVGKRYLSEAGPEWGGAYLLTGASL